MTLNTVNAVCTHSLLLNLCLSVCLCVCLSLYIYKHTYRERERERERGRERDWGVGDMNFILKVLCLTKIFDLSHITPVSMGLTRREIKAEI